ncbi:MAG: hypothetical protein ACFFCV_15740 [Promethearchaeota archaeon]
MNDKFAEDIQTEINEILCKLEKWNNYFDKSVEFYIDGWAIYLREKNLYPRCITIFKSYCSNTYSIKSFEVHLKDYKKEEFNELYFTNNISNQNKLLEELNAVIYGKDLVKKVSKIYQNSL